MTPHLRGLLLGLATVGVALLLPPELSVALLALLLAFAAAVYVGIAEAGPERSEARLQWTVALAFVVLALLGLWVSTLVLAGGWWLHAAWDWRHHRSHAVARAAPWYPPTCLTYDLTVAAFAYVLWRVGG